MTRARSRSPPPCGRWRAPATAARRWSRSRRSTPVIRCSARSTPTRRCRSPTCSRERDGAFGAAADPALLARLDLKVGDRIAIGSATIELRAALTQRARQARRRHRPRPAPADRRSGACARAACYNPAAWCAGNTGCACRGCRHRRQRRDGDRKTRPSGISGCRLGNPHPQQGVAAARTQCRALHPIPDAGRLDHASGRRRRRRQCGHRSHGAQARRDRHHESARRHRRRHFRRLLREIMLVALLGTLIGAAIGARAAVRGGMGCSAPLIPFPVAPALYPGVLLLAIALRAAHRIGLRAVAARARPRHPGVAAVSRPDRDRAATGRGRAI